jgi:hypothetical protein
VEQERNFGVAEDADQYLRVYNNVTTWVAEALEGNMRSEFSYTYDGANLRAEDGGSMDVVFTQALEDAKKLLLTAPNLAFEYRRRLIESAEYKDMLAMARGELPNTMIVVSDFPPELMRASQDVGGYNVTRKQTFLRVITRAPDGRFTMYSQSLDGSNRQALEALYRHSGFAAPAEGELLGQRMHLQADQIRQRYLTSELTGVYDRSLGEQLGGDWRAGRQQLHERSDANTLEFVRSQHDLVNLIASEELAGKLPRNRLYDITAALSRRFQKYVTGGHISPTNFGMDQSNVIRWQLEQELRSSGQEARQQGVTFSACGDSVSNNEAAMRELDPDGQLKAAGYGNKSSEVTKYSFDKKMHCVVCQAPPEKNASKKWCGPCGICQLCDIKMQAKSVFSLAT